MTRTRQRPGEPGHRAIESGDEINTDSTPSVLIRLYHHDDGRVGLRLAVDEDRHLGIFHSESEAVLALLDGLLGYAPDTLGSFLDAASCWLVAVADAGDEFGEES